MALSFFADLGPGSPRQAVSRADLALGGGLAIVAVMSGLYVDASRPDTLEPTRWWHWLLLVMPPILVVLRRVDPIVVPLIAALFQSIIWVIGLPDVLLPMLVILYSAGADGGRRGARLAVAITAILTVVTSIGVASTDEVTPYLVPLVAVSCVTAIVLGVNAARSSSLAVELATTIAETRLRNEHEQAAALADERSRIARDLHDIIGHTLSVIAVRAEAAHRVADRKPEAAGDAVAAIAVSARAALTDTRRVLAGLRTSSDLELAPPPDLAAIRQLVDRLAEAGVDAEVESAPCETCFPSALVAGSAFRIVQESLTNAVRHGPPDVRIRVGLDCQPNHLDVTVISTLANPSPVDLGQRGLGLVGMAERADVLGGSLSARPEGAHFVVRATLPADGLGTGTPIEAADVSRAGGEVHR